MVETVRRVVCDRCGAAAPEALASENPEELARNAGWKTYGDPKDGELTDICPDCQKDSEA